MKYFDFYHIPSGINKDIADLIIDQFAADKGMEPGTLEQIKKVDPVIRVCDVKWLNTDSWVAGMLAHFIHTANINLYEFDLVEWATPIQFTSYSKPGHHYDWHVDNDVNMQHEPPVRKISMTCLLSPESEFEGGDLELMSEGKIAKLKQGHAVFFASFIRHRVKPVIKGRRQSLVMWFGGTPFK